MFPDLTQGHGSRSLTFGKQLPNETCHLPELTTVACELPNTRCFGMSPAPELKVVNVALLNLRAASRSLGNGDHNSDRRTIVKTTL